MFADNHDNYDNHDGCDWYFGVPFKSKRKEAEMAGRKFKVGDRVRFTEAVTREGWWFKGEIGTVSSTNRSGYPYTVSVDNSDDDIPAFVDDEHIRHIFPRGTRIQLLRDHGVYKAGHRGTVTYENDENVGALMDIGRYAAFPHDVVGGADDTAPDCAERKVEREFKAGDVIRALHDCENGGYYRGDTFTVQRGHGDFFEFIDNDGDQRYRGTDEFELVTPAPCPQDNEQAYEAPPFRWGIQDTAIVALINKDGKPRPSQWPHVHPSVRAATAEAERLARNNPGTEFAVYQRVAGRRAEVEYKMKEVA